MTGFDEFVAARGNALLRFAYLLCGDAYLAEDLVQTVLARVYAKWLRVAATERPEAYVKKMLVNEHLSWRRRRSSGEVSVAAPDGGAAEGSAEALAERDAAWRLLATLPRRQRAVLVLRYYEDLSDAGSRTRSAARSARCGPTPRARSRRYGWTPVRRCAMGGEDVLRETFATYADRAPRGDTLAAVAKARAKVAARRRAGLTVAAAAASVAVVAYGAVALVPRGDDRPATGSDEPVRDPSLTQRVYEGGLEFYVPASWPRDETNCNAPQQDTVVTRWSGLACLAQEPDGLSVAYVLPVSQWRGTELELRDVRRRQATMRGFDVQHVTGVHTRDGRAVSAVVVPGMLHAVWVVSPDAALAARITATVRVVDADFQGCPPSRRRIAPAPPERPGATQRMVPDGAVSASACRYDAEGSILVWHALSEAELASLARLLNALPPGFADPPPAENIACERYHSDPAVVTFRYASGPDVPVYVNFTGCTELGASNGAVHGAATDDLVWKVNEFVGLGDRSWNRWDDFRD